MRRLWRHRLDVADERGVALVMALIVVGALTISTVALSSLVSSNQRSVGRDRQELLAFNTAEAGINYGVSALTTTVDPSGAAAYGATAFYPATAPTAGIAFNDSSGSGTWWARKDTATTWRIWARGDSPSGIVRRTVSVKVKAAIQPGATVPASPAWSKGLFVGNPGTGCFRPGGTADLTISVYVKGCIDLSGTATIKEPSTSTAPSISVFAETTISTGNGNNDFIGTNAKKVLSVVAPGGCTGRSGIICSQTGSRVYAMSYTGPSPNITKPTIDPQARYDSGLWFAPVCTIGTFTFDNDTTRNTSAGTVDLFTALPYDCRVFNTSGAEVGRLAWNPVTNALLVTGTLYIDGNLRMNNNVAAGYTTPSGTTPLGATIYLDGTVTMNGTAALCGPPSVPSGGVCSTPKWDADYGALFLVAVNAQDSTDPFAVSWTANGGAYYDVAAYVVGQYKKTGNGGATGPVITDTADVSGNSSSVDIPEPPPNAPGGSYTSPGSTTWGVIPATWQQLTG